MALRIIETKEVIEDGVTYIITTYSNGTVVKTAKPSEVEPVEPEAPELTQLDLIQQAVEKSNNELRQEGADTAILELIKKGIL
jgi:hypothetical protein